MIANVDFGTWLFNHAWPAFVMTLLGGVLVFAGILSAKSPLKKNWWSNGESASKIIGETAAWLIMTLFLFWLGGFLLLKAVPEAWSDGVSSQGSHFENLGRDD